MSQTKVFVVDDSALVRQFMADVIAQYPDLTLIGSAPDPVAALPKMRNQWPDVIVLDMEMPRMDGLTFLRQLMHDQPTPVVICSSLTPQGANLTLEALAAGAVAVFAKATLGVRGHLEAIANDLVAAIREASRAQFQRHRPVAASATTKSEPVAVAPAAFSRTTDRVVMIGTSTGGTLALEYLLTRLPADGPPIAVVQHMPEAFTAAFSQRLDSLCAMQVAEASHGDWLTTGRALIAPGGKHIQVVRSGAHYQVEVLDGPPINRHKPSVDVLFRSAAKAAGANAMGVIMTGMGDDGARGLLAMREAGAYTVAQDEATCVVFGMPKEAIRLGAAHQVVGLPQIPALMQQFVRG